MAKFDALVAIVIIIAIVILVSVRSANRSAETRKNLSNTLLLNRQYKNALWKIRAEVSTQLMAGYSDVQPIHVILDDLDKEIDK